jgi:thymidine phosphorylase
MDEPLGFAVGNANEVVESLTILSCGDERLNDIADLCIEFAARMVSQEKGISLEDAKSMCREKLEDGSAKAKFIAMVEAHGGNLARFEDMLRQPTAKFRVQAMRSGYVASIDAEKVAKVAFALGAGRERTGDKIDALAGVTLAVKHGDKVSVGAPLATLESTREPELLERLASDLLKAFTIVAERPEPRRFIIEAID